MSPVRAKGLRKGTSYSGVNRFVRAVMVTSGSAPVELLKCGLLYPSGGCQLSECFVYTLSLPNHLIKELGGIYKTAGKAGGHDAIGRRDGIRAVAVSMRALLYRCREFNCLGQIRYRIDSRSSLGRRRKNNRTESRRLKCIDQWFCDTRLKH